MLMHLNPNKVYANESLNTLRFAQKVNNTNIGTAQKVRFYFNSYSENVFLNTKKY